MSQNAASPMSASPASSQSSPWLMQTLNKVLALFALTPDTLIAFVARFSIAAVFWKGGQTKIEGLKLDFVAGQFQLGWPRLADSTIDLFKDEYHMPFAEILAPLAAFSEHLFAALLLIGLATRFSALALLGMTLVIQIFVYPGLYTSHGVWAACLLYLMAKGPGKISLDHFIARRFKG